MKFNTWFLQVSDFSKVIFIFPLILISIFIYQGCQESFVSSADAVVLENIDEFDIKKVNLEELNTDRKYIAKALADLLKNEKYRIILEQEKIASNNREEILDASVFLNKEFNIESKSTKLISEMSKTSAMSKVSDDAENSISRIIKLHKGYVDIYFPIDEHREKWKSNNNELYVAVYDRGAIDNNKGFLTAFDLSGNELLIDVSKIPTVPTLVVALSETHGKYPLKESSDRYFQSIKKSGAVSSVSSEQVPQVDSYLKVNDFFVRDAVGDGFWDAPEYYISVRHPSGTAKTDTRFWDCWQSGHGYFGLDRIVYTYPHPIPYGCGYGVPCPVTTHIEIWDDDGGWADEDDPIEVNFGVADNYCNGNDLDDFPFGWFLYWFSRKWKTDKIS